MSDQHIDDSFPGATIFASVDSEHKSQEGIVFCDSRGRIGFKGVSGDKFLLLSAKTDFKEAEANLGRMSHLPVLVPEGKVESRGPPSPSKGKDIAHNGPIVWLSLRPLVLVR